MSFLSTVAAAASADDAASTAGSTYSFYVGTTQYNVLQKTLSAKSTVGRRGELAATVYFQPSSVETWVPRLLGGPFPLNVAGAPVHFQQYQRCSLYNTGGDLVWAGYLTNPQETKPGFQSLLVTQMTATDQHYLADKRIVAKGYRNQTCGAMIRDMVTNILAAEGVTVGSISNGPVVPVANFGYVTVASALDALVTAASASGSQWYWMIDQFKQLWFVPYTAVVGPAIDGTLIDDGRASGQVPTVTRANPKYRNKQYAVGGVSQVGPNDETRAGDGQTRSFTYSYPFAAAPSTATLNGTSVTVGVKGQTGFQYYYAVGDPVIAQDSGQTVLVSTDHLRMVYLGQEPTNYVASDAAQITAQAAIDGTSGIIEAVLTDTSITTANQGNAEVQQQLTQYGQNGLLFQFATLQTGLAVGQQCAITYTPLGFSAAQMLLTEIDVSDQQDGINLWQTVSAMQGPYDTTWAQFFGNILAPEQVANSINLGISIPNPLYPSTTLDPSTTLYPGG